MTTFATESEGSGGSTDDTGSRVVFINEQEKLPYLCVSKKVTGTNAPADDVFTFTLERLAHRGEAEEAWETVTGQWYQVFNVTDTAYENPIPDANGSKDYPLLDGGRFTLKDGQKARFKLEAGQRYRVTETEKNYYTSVTKSQTVTMQLKTETMVFENLYKINPDKEDYSLTVEKKVEMPEGYSVPDTPEFTFKLEVKRRKEFEPYGGQPFKVIGSGSNSTEENKVTESDGTFRLRANDTALFDFSELSENYSNAIYRITELHLDEAKETEAGADLTREDWKNWWLIGEGEEREGKVSAGETETFTNANASFAVRKELAEGAESDPKAEFTFLLKADNKVGSDIPYYLYDEWGNRIIDSANNGVNKTDSEGKFKLKFDQTALFLGMAPHTNYRVNEEVDDAYRQTEPLTAQGLPDGYGGEVQEKPEILVFKNEPLPPAGLVVAKKIINADGEVPEVGSRKSFKFVLMKQVPAAAGEDGAEEIGEGQYVKYEAVTGAGYSTGTTDGETDDEGCFSLEYNQQALFETLTPGEIYRVVEVLDDNLLLEYKFAELAVKSGEAEPVTMAVDDSRLYKKLPILPKDTEEIQNSGQNADYEEVYGWQTSLVKGERVSFFFTNSYRPVRINLELTKVNLESAVLPGAVFTLYRNADLTNPVTQTLSQTETEGDEEITNDPLDEENASDPLTDETKDNVILETSEFVTNENGMLTFEDLKPGTYWLKEIKAPSGYSLLANPVKIGIEAGVNKGQKKITVTIDDRAYDATVSEGVETRNEIVLWIKAEISETGNDLVQIKVCNANLYNLPSAGGVGIYWYSIGGVLLMMAAALILYKYKRTGEVQGDC